eukprot:251242-Prorocentrum_minimum.AAC.1
MWPGAKSIASASNGVAGAVDGVAGGAVSAALGAAVGVARPYGAGLVTDGAKGAEMAAARMGGAEIAAASVGASGLGSCRRSGATTTTTSGASSFRPRRDISGRGGAVEGGRESRRFTGNTATVVSFCLSSRRDCSLLALVAAGVQRQAAYHDIVSHRTVVVRVLRK